MLGRKMAFQMQGRAYARKQKGCQYNGRLRGKPRRKLPKFDEVHTSTTQEAR